MLAAGLAATVAAVTWIGGENGGSATLLRTDGEPAVPPVRPATLVPSSARRADSHAVTLPQRAMTQEFADIFANGSWEPPPVERAPELPTLPFSYVGRMVVQGEVTAFLEAENGMHAIRAGQTVDDQYLVDEIDGDTVSLTYLPLGVRQTLQLRALSDIAPTAEAPATGRRARRARLDAIQATTR